MNSSAVKVIARNTVEDSPNPMHNASGAARYGFAGALVPGNTTYAYVADAVAMALGDTWDAHAHAVVRFTAPVYDREVLQIELDWPEDPGVLEPVRFAVAKADGAVCARGSVELLDTEISPPPVTDFPQVVLPDVPVAFSEDHLLDHELLGQVPFVVDKADQEAMLAAIGAPLGEHRHAAHSAWLAKWYWPLISSNVRREGAGIHVAEDLTHYRHVRFGEQLVARGRFEALYGRRGSRYYEIKVGLIDAEDRVVMVARHTAIYQYVAARSPTDP